VSWVRHDVTCGVREAKEYDYDKVRKLSMAQRLNIDTASSVLFTKEIKPPTPDSTMTTSTITTTTTIHTY